MRKAKKEMTPDQAKAKEERRAIYANTRQDLLTRNLSNSKMYDNAILTLSTGILGLSLAFIKDIVPLDKSQYVFLLKISWWVFGASIVSTLISFVVGQLAIKRQLEYAEKYYLDEEDEYLKKKNRPALLTDFVNYTSGILFIVGILTTILFVSVNIKGGNTMTKDTMHSTRGKGEAAPIVDFQKVQTGKLKSVKKGAPIPKMQPIKPSTSTTKQSDSQGSQSGGNTGKTTK